MVALTSKKQLNMFQVLSLVILSISYTNKNNIHSSALATEKRGKYFPLKCNDDNTLIDDDNAGWKAVKKLYLVGVNVAQTIPPNYLKSQ